jgi:hypothetical protein
MLENEHETSFNHFFFVRVQHFSQFMQRQLVFFSYELQFFHDDNQIDVCDMFRTNFIYDDLSSIKKNSLDLNRTSHNFIRVLQILNEKIIVQFDRSFRS